MQTSTEEHTENLRVEPRERLVGRTTKGNEDNGSVCNLIKPSPGWSERATRLLPQTECQQTPLPSVTRVLCRERPIKNWSPRLNDATMLPHTAGWRSCHLQTMSKELDCISLVTKRRKQSSVPMQGCRAGRSGEQLLTVMCRITLLCEIWCHSGRENCASLRHITLGETMLPEGPESRECGRTTVSQSSR